jgi:hypothetical protein
MKHLLHTEVFIISDNGGGEIAWIIKNMEMPTVSAAFNPEWFMLLMITFLTNLSVSVVSMEAQQFP